MKVPGHHGHHGVVAVSPVGRGLPLEPALALLPILVPVRAQVKKLKDALPGIVQVLILILNDPDNNFINFSGWLLGFMDTLEQM